MRLARSRRVYLLVIFFVYLKKILKNMQEIFKDIVGYSNYQVSNFGMVKSLERKAIVKGGSMRTVRVAKTQTNCKKSKPVRCLETGVVYPSTKEVERQLGFSQGNITRCCNGKLKSAYGYHWEHV